MGLINMLKPGMWYTRSESDPRWNHSEEDSVGMFDHSRALAWAEAQKPILGELPEDLEVGYHKY